jgi:transposase
MIQVTSHVRIVVAVEPVDFRNGIDGLARICKEVLKADPFAGWLFVFRSRRGKSIKALGYDGQGFWLCQKRMSSGKFRFWPGKPADVSKFLEAHELQVLLAGGDPAGARGAPAWRRIHPVP